MKLIELKNAQIGVIRSVKNLPTAKLKRLFELGFVYGTKIKMLKNDRMSKIMLVGIRGYTISLDYKIGENIEIEVGNSND